MSDPLTRFVGKPKIALVIPWYGLESAGGAEIHARRLVESLHQAGVTVEVLTSCGKDSFSRELGDFYPEGLSEVNGIPVRRFPLRQDEGDSFFLLHPKLLSGVERPRSAHYHPANDLVVSNALFDFVQAHREEYYFVFMLYVFGLSVYGAVLEPERTFLIPCLHDESWAYDPIYKPMFTSARGILFNSGPEMDLAQRLYSIDPQTAAVIGEGIDMHWRGDAWRFRHKFGLYDPFVFYVGRRDEGKRTPHLISYFCEYKRRRGGPARLVLAGKNPVHIPPDFAQDVVDLGFISEQDKHDAYAAADVFCLPSVVESFSIVMMEAWLQGTAVLVNSECAVTVDHCRRSNGGLHFRGYLEFESCLELLLARPDLRRRMGRLGDAYVRGNYCWEDVVERFIQQIYGPEAPKRA